MAKINNRGIYKNIDSPSLSDFLLGTKEEDGKTKSFPLQYIIQLINGVNGKNNIQYKFSDGSDPDIDYTTSGMFFTNNNSTSLPNFTELIFNKENLQPFDLSLLFNKIGVYEDIILKLEHPENPNIFFNLKVISFVDNTEYFVFGVQPFKDFYLGILENEKIYSIYFDLHVISEEEKADKIIKSGDINISGLTISILENDFQWRINQQDFLNTPELINFPIPPAADGFYRSDILVGTSNNDYQLIQGTPDSSASVEPQAPINTIRIAGISLFGAIVGQPTPTPITNFIEKSERANVVLTGSGVINQLNLVDEKATIVFKGSITRLNTISYASVPYNGKRITLFNAQATPVTIGHSVSGYGFDFVFPDAQDYVLVPNQTIEFSFDITYAPYAHHMLIGSKTDISGKEDKANKNIANGYAGLDSSGKINPIQLPALAITDTFVVASQAEQLALVAEVGDVAVRTDLNKSFILRVTGASTLANWQELMTPVSVDQTIIDGSTNAVSGNAVFDGLALKSNIGHTHVASQITDLSKASVGLGNVDNTSDLSKPLSTATINALATKAPISSVHNPVTIGTANGLSLSNQQISLGLASSGVTGALSGTDWNTFNGKFNTPTGLTNNYLPKWDGSGFGNSNIVDTNNEYYFENTNGRLTFGTSLSETYIFSTTTSFTSFKKLKITSNNLVFNNGTTDLFSFLSNGRALFNTTTDNGVDEIQVNGTISASPATTANQVPTWGQVQAAAARPYKAIVFSIIQAGTNAPTLNIYENNSGGTFFLSRNGVGIYTATFSGVVLTGSKTVIFVNGGNGGNGILKATYVNSNTIQFNNYAFNTANLVDGLSGNETFVEIRIYP